MSPVNTSSPLPTLTSGPGLGTLPLHFRGDVGGRTRLTQPSLDIALDRGPGGGVALGITESEDE